MKKNLLKTTAILCGLTALPGIALGTAKCKGGECKKINNHPNSAIQAQVVTTPGPGKNIAIPGENGAGTKPKNAQHQNKPESGTTSDTYTPYSGTPTKPTTEHQNKPESGTTSDTYTPYSGTPTKPATEYPATQEVGTNPDTYAPSKREDFRNHKVRKF